MERTQKTWDFIYEDSNGNELQRKQLDCFDRKDAEQTAFSIQQNSMLADLDNIRVQFMPIKWARKCSVTNQGMNEGWHIEYTGEYFKTAEDAEAACQKAGFDNLDIANEDEYIYWTEWMDESDDAYIEDENGVLTEIQN